ncbi:ATP-binding cassette domain-containing protein [Desulfovibrio sp. 1188_IL3213]|uniref:ATP-binding cassette domain-containing protein n=1 Tax=Desulfovibrio sp. 1188_IL3213 TaxID=3084052 RepID=UPI002FDA1B6F
MDNLVFSLRRISKSRPGAEGFSLRVERLDIPRSGLLALVGPSGCGKSTALDLLACILRPDTHSATDDGKEQRFLFSPEPHEDVDVLRAWGTGGPNALALLRQRPRLQLP